MNMGFGQYSDKPVAWVLLENSQYFMWMKNNGMAEKPQLKFALQLVNVFDELPFKNVRCHGDCGGQNPVTRLSLYNGNFNGQYWFCDKCNPYNNGANLGKLMYVSKLSSVFGNKEYYTIIKAMANAKGVPHIKTEKALKEFFGY